MVIRISRNKIQIFVCVVGVVLGVWAFYFEPASFSIKKYSLKIPALNISNSYRIVVAADLHVGSAYYPLSRLDSEVEAINREDPDLILLAGDFMAHHKGRGEDIPPEKIAEKLGQLKARDGVFAVLGNHDWWYDPQMIVEAMQRHGIKMIDESFVKIGDRFYLMGIDDFTEGSPRPEKVIEAIPSDLPVIALTHNPDIFPKVPRRVALTVAGHTHGGQVNFPVLGRLIVPSNYGSRYAAGLITENGHQLFVSTGVGTSILPVRFLVPPEVSILEIQSQ
jgi:uncharacterized protein